MEKSIRDIDREYSSENAVRVIRIIDNVKMWQSLIEGNSVTYENGMTERGDLARRIINALKDQGLEYKDGKIVSKEEIKGNQREVSPNPSELTEFEKAIALLIFNSQNTCNSIKVCEEQARKESKALLTFARKQITSDQPVAWSEEDREMVAWLIRCCEKEYKELCNDRYGHQEIVSDLKRDCRKKWEWLEKLQKIIEG